MIEEWSQFTHQRWRQSIRVENGGMCLLHVVINRSVEEHVSDLQRFLNVRHVVHDRLDHNVSNNWFIFQQKDPKIEIGRCEKRKKNGNSELAEVNVDEEAIKDRFREWLSSVWVLHGYWVANEFMGASKGSVDEGEQVRNAKCVLAPSIKDVVQCVFFKYREG